MPVSTEKFRESDFILEEHTIHMESSISIKIHGCKFNLDQYHDDISVELGVAEMSCSSRNKARRAEFCAGRYLAQKALRDYGIHETVGTSSGAPLWPAGFGGSISHGEGHAICAVAPKSKVKYLGLDIELAIDDLTANDISRFVVTQDELDLAKNRNYPRNQFLATAFSAKESLFKAISHECDKKFNFLSSGVIEIYKDARTIKLELFEELSPSLKRGLQFECHVGSYEQFILTLVAI